MVEANRFGVHASVTVNIYLLPLVDSGNGPKISMADLSNGLPTNISPNGAYKEDI